MLTDLAQLRTMLIEGQKASGQGSYQRRAPGQAAMALLIPTRNGLQRYAECNPSDPEGWKLLSLAEECLLNYPMAETHLLKAIALSTQKDRRDLKRLALLKESKATWKELSLTPQQLASLGRHLEAKLAISPCQHTLKLTTEWLKEIAVAERSKVLNGLRSQGGYCDCEVLANVAR